ncbi:MAG: Flp pilus assembly protein CpaB [Candidatus Omnitrophica bacterium]|nr:Flp pilus assembly protein CpaB [Candidatus Omnitrophota bacterium]MDD5670201.1 Flp pilus assembly protein CpaB [Candidatus Omnitrophota bacterium]
MGILKQHLPLIVAIAFAVISSISVYSYLGNRESVSIAKVVPSNPVLPVVVAKQDLAIGTKLTRDLVTTQNWPKEIVNDRYFRNAGQVVGRILRTGVTAEEPLTSSKLLEEGATLSTLIPKDMRAITVSIRRSQHLEKILGRGCLVDVIAVPGEGKSMRQTKVIAKAVRVLAVQSSDAKDAEKYSDTMEVTLIGTTTDANLIVYSMSHGGIELSVRNESEKALGTNVSMI